MIKDAQFNKFIKYKKYVDVFDFASIECKIALISAIALAGVSYFSTRNNTLENINILISALTKDIAVALISFLGFTVSGLAILTGVISKKEVQTVMLARKIEHLEKILLSFYLLGLVTAITVVGLICCFIFGVNDSVFSERSFIVLVFVFSYLVVFVLFYAVKLIGNCLEIFFIVNSGDERNNENEVMQCYDSYRITALERVLIPPLGKEGYELYKGTIEEQIANNKNVGEKIELEKIYAHHFTQRKQ